MEKPLALNSDQLSAIQEGLLTHHASLLTVGFNRRFAPLAQQLAGFLENRSEALYAHYRINAGYIPLSHWTHDPEQGGGRIIGEGCHFIDFITFLVGAAPVSVSAVALPDGGKYRVSLDGAELGTVDFYADPAKSAVQNWGERQLTAGDHVLRFECVGKADKSQGHNLGFYELTTRTAAYTRPPGFD